MVTYKGKIREKPKDLEEATALLTNFDAEKHVMWGFQIDFAMGKRAFLLLIREELGATVGDFVVAERVLFWAVPGAVQGAVARAEKWWVPCLWRRCWLSGAVHSGCCLMKHGCPRAMEPIRKE